MRTLWHEKSLSEGNYKRINRVHFNYDVGKAVWWQTQYSGNPKDFGIAKPYPVWKEKSGILEGIRENMQDVLSMLYWLRIHPMEPAPGREFTVEIFDDSRISRIHISILSFEK